MERRSPLVMPDENNSHPAYAGNFRHAMDSKHRITIPSRWRQGDGDQFFLLPSQDSMYLSVLPPSEFKKVNETVSNDPKISPADRRWFARFYFSQAQHCVLDKQGRLLLPDEFCQIAGLVADTVLVGTFDRFEIWSPERWETAKLRGSSTYQQVANLIGFKNAYANPGFQLRSIHEQFAAGEIDSSSTW